MKNTERITASLQSEK